MKVEGGVGGFGVVGDRGRRGKKEKRESKKWEINECGQLFLKIKYKNKKLDIRHIIDISVITSHTYS